MYTRMPMGIRTSGKHASPPCLQLRENSLQIEIKTANNGVGSSTTTTSVDVLATAVRYLCLSIIICLLAGFRMICIA